MSLPRKNVAYEFTMPLDSILLAGFQANPTIAAGDFKVSIDNGTYTNLTTLPVVDPIGSINVKINLSAAEMNGDKVTIQALDVAGDEWEEVFVFFDLFDGNTEQVVDLLEGDHSESSTNIIIKKKGTSTEILNKNVTGSLLSPSITITTSEP